MANRQPAVLNQKVAHVLWELIDTQITFRKHIQRRAKRDTIGFVDLVFDLTEHVPGLKFGFRNLVVSRVNGKSRIDMPAEKGRDGEWYPHYYPLSYELREVLTQRIFRHPEVEAAVLELPNHPVQSSAEPAKGDSPFQSDAPAAAAADNPFPTQGQGASEPEVEAEPEDEDIDQILADIRDAAEAGGVDI